jgi:hypothetical protein
MQQLEHLLSGPIEPGMYRIPADANPQTIQRLVEAQGWRYFHVDGAAVQDKRSFIRAAGDAMHFPAYSGQNWDAFEESLRDLTWAPAKGYLVLFDEPDQFAARDPEQWTVARDVLEDAIRFWRKQGAPMVVLFRRAGRALPEIPWL